MSEWQVPWTDIGIPHFVRPEHQECSTDFGRTVHAISWRDPEPFHATLTWAGMVSKRSALYFTWVDGPYEFSMFATDLHDMVMSFGVQPVTTGWWKPVKRDGNYGISYERP